jgi:hypothetical protein
MSPHVDLADFLFTRTNKTRGPGFIECMNTALVIPIYCPNEKVLPFLKSFKANDFGLFVVVDDGSGEQYAAGLRRDPGFRAYSPFFLIRAIKAKATP